MHFSLLLNVLVCLFRLFFQITSLLFPLYIIKTPQSRKFLPVPSQLPFSPFFLLSSPSACSVKYLNEFKYLNPNNSQFQTYPLPSLNKFPTIVLKYAPETLQLKCLPKVPGLINQSFYHPFLVIKERNILICNLQLLPLHPQ